MIRLIQWLIFGHIHKYKQVSVEQIVSDKKIKAKFFIMRCECCGKMKTFKVYT